MAAESLLRRPLPSLAFWIAGVFALAALAALGSRDAPEFYRQLLLPAWAPPAAVFGPVWSTLYAMMAVAAWLVWRSTGQHRAALGLFAAQLAANVLWSWIYFDWRSGALATVDVIVLLALIVATTVAFFRVRLAAGLLMLPYLAWVSFATALTISTWQRNPNLL
jgi:tryptophan-rich sensory protein